MLHLLHDWFGWPDGSVLTNLVASVIVGFLAVWKLVRSHKALHSKLDRLHSHLGVPPENDDA